MTLRSVRRDPACEVVVENGSRRGKVTAVAEPDLGEDLVERDLSGKRRKVLVPDVRLDAGLFEQGPQQVRFYEVGCGVELFHSSTHFAPDGGEPWLLAKGPARESVVVPELFESCGGDESAPACKVVVGAVSIALPALRPVTPRIRREEHSA